MQSPLYLLDTGILLHFIRGGETWDRIREEYQLFLIEPKPLISIVTGAELKSLALQFDWGVQKVEQLEFALGYFDVIPIDSDDLVETYARIDNFSLKIGKALGKNDLWLAASTVVLDAKLMTMDRDFDALDPEFLSRILIT